MPSPYEVVSFDGTTIDGSTDYVSLFAAGDTWMLTAPITTQQRRGTSPLVTSTALDGRVLPPLHIFRKNGAAGTVTTHRTVVPKLFDPSKNRAGVRYLVMYWSDGTTVVRIGCDVTQLQTDLDNPNHFVASLYAPSPYWEANSATTSAASPATVTNAGNAPAYPSVALTTANHVTRRACTVAAVGAGGGTVAYPIKFLVSDTACTTATTSVYVEGVEVPCFVGASGGAGSYVWALVDTAADGSTTNVDILYGGGRTGSALGVLDDGGMDWADTSTTNTLWEWDAWLISSYPARPGTWRPARTGNHNSQFISYGISAEAAGGVTFTIGAEGAYDNGADSMVLVVGNNAGVTNALSNLTRITAGMDGTNARAFVRYRTAGSAIWLDAWTSRTSTTVSAAIDLDNAVEIAIGIENDGPNPDSASLQITTATATTLAFGASAPSVVIGAVENFDRYNGPYTIGATSITFSEVNTTDGTLTVDCAARTITQSVAGPFYGNLSWSDPDVWLEMPGTAAATTVTDGISAADTITHRNGWS